MAIKNSKSDKPIDISHLQEISGGDEDFEQMIIQEFIETSAELLEELQTAVEDGDIIEIQSIAHNLKGCSRNVGAGPFAEVCLAIENQVRSENPEVEDLMENLRERWQDVADFAA